MKSQQTAPAYRFDYKKAKPNRFTEKMKDSPIIIVLDADVAKVFTTAEEVNRALRAIISVMPAKKTKATAK